MASENHLRIGDLLMHANVVNSSLIADVLVKYENKGLPLGKVLVLSGCLDDLQLRNAVDLQFMVNDGLLALDSAVQIMQTAFEKKLDLTEAFREAKVLQPEDRETNKLGQLLYDSHIASDALINTCLESAHKTSLPLGHVLCQRGFVSQTIINKALLVQQVIRKNQITREQGIAALAAAQQRENTLAKLPSNQGYRARNLKNTPLMGALLVEVCGLSERQLRDSLLSSILERTTLGAILLQNKNYSKNLLQAVVSLQEMLDNQTIEEQTGMRSLEAVFNQNISLEQACAEAYTFTLDTNHAVELIELLAAASIIEKSQLSSSIIERLSVNYNQVSYVAKELINDGVAINTVYTALRATQLVRLAIISDQEAILYLEQAHHASMPIDEVLYLNGKTQRTRLKEEK
ncbi:hypothetical protein KA183_02730 [bacterium]|nr:hypothetical protein [bacterium]QQR58701.1 MAG: hypothetical protein IPG59_04165 [Candidatus Melainabacteria bacterium]